MDELTAKLRARDRADAVAALALLRKYASRARKESELWRHWAAVGELVYHAQALHARRGTLNLPSTQQAIARFVF